MKTMDTTSKNNNAGSPAVFSASAPETPAAASGTLQSRNIRIHNRRTSVRLEPEMWNALNEIATIEGCTIHQLCTAVHDLKDAAASFTAALRVFMMEFYRSAARTDTRVSQVQRRIKENINHHPAPLDNTAESLADEHP